MIMKPMEIGGFVCFCSLDPDDECLIGNSKKKSVTLVLGVVHCPNFQKKRQTSGFSRFSPPK